MNYNFSLLSAESSLEELIKEWRVLAEKIKNVSFLHMPEWFVSHLNVNREDKKNTYFAIMRQGAELVAVFPLQYRRMKRFGVSMNAWSIFWSGDMGLNDFIYIANEGNQDILNRLIVYLNQQNNFPWNLLMLQNIAENASVYYSLSRVPPRRSIIVYDHDSKHIECKPTFEESVSGISSKFKRNNRRKQRKLEQSGPIDFRLHSEGQELDTAFDQFVEIEAANWKGKNKTAMKYDARQHAFYKELVREFGATHECNIHMLYLNENPIAAQFALNVNDTFHLLKIGYNAKYHDVGPGGLLLNETIRRFSGHSKIQKISFVTGAKWNDDWAPIVLKVYDNYIYNSNIRGYYAFILEYIKSLLRTIKHTYFSKGTKIKL